MGDFNYPRLEWENFEADRDSERLLEWSLENGMTQYVDFPNRGGNTLDLLFTSEVDMVDNLKSYGSLGESDHVIIVGEICTFTGKSVNTAVVPVFKGTNWKGLRQRLKKVDWSSLETDPLEQAWENFKTKLDGIVNHYLKFQSRNVNKRPMWMNRSVLQSVRRKARMWNI